ncbi:MAG: TetR/AcrR family transcriptional regulator [Leptospirales bacterium]
MPKTICSKEDWLKLGLLRFAKSGPTALIIEKMASTLGCAKTSFYNYFGNRERYIDEIIEFWVQYTTHHVGKKLNEIESPLEKLKFLTEYLFSTKEMENFYFYFRELANENPNYRRILDENELYRMNALSDILQTLNLTKANSLMKAEIYYDYFFGWHDRNKHLSITPGILRKQFKIISNILGVPINY